MAATKALFPINSFFSHRCHSLTRALHLHPLFSRIHLQLLDDLGRSRSEIWKKEKSSLSRATILFLTYLAGVVFSFEAVVSIPSTSLYIADDSQHTILFNLSCEVIDDAIDENSNLISSFHRNGLSCVCEKIG